MTGTAGSDDAMRVGVMIFATDQTMPMQHLAPEVEARGFDSLWVTEKTHVPVSRATPWPGGELPEWYKRTCDPFVALAAAAATTTRLRVAFEQHNRDPDTALVTVYSSQGDPALLASYQDADINRVVVWLPPAAETTVLSALDDHVERLGEYLT